MHPRHEFSSRVRPDRASLRRLGRLARRAGSIGGGIGVLGPDDLLGAAAGGFAADVAKARGGIAALVERYEALVRRGDLIVAGPWTAELAFELLYWIPFLRWLDERVSFRDRLVVVSCGGNESWYGDLASRYIDVFDLLSLDELREIRAASVTAAEQSGGLSRTKRKNKLSPVGGKTRENDIVGRTIVERASKSEGLEDFVTLDPSGAWRLASKLRKLDEAGVNAMTFAPLRFARITPPSLDLAAMNLPERFVVARFYAGTGTSKKRDGERIVRSVIEAVAAQAVVVLLDPGLRVDDKHFDFAVDGVDVVRIPTLELAGNLDVQTAIIAKAQAYVGSYGGFSWLPPLLGVPTVAVSTRSLEIDRHLRFHTALARHMVSCDSSCGEYLVVGQDTLVYSKLVGAVAETLEAHGHPSERRSSGE